MTSFNYTSPRLKKGRGPLKAYYLPTSTSAQSVLTTNKESKSPVSLLKTYWTDSEDALSIMSSFSEDSSSSTSMPRYTCTPTLNQTSRVSNSNLQQHFPTIVGVKRSNGYVERKGSESCVIACACCSPSAPAKRPLVAMGAGGLRAMREFQVAYQPPLTAPSTPSSQHLAPICPVPMLPPHLGCSGLPDQASPVRRSIETQTSPPEDNKKRARHSHSRRSSGALLSSIKRKIDHIRRSVSSDRTGTRTLLRNASNPDALKRRNDEVAGVTKCTLLQRFADESRLVQLRRRSTSDQFGLFIKVDSKGLCINRLGNIEFTGGGRNCLRAGDRVVEVQNIPAKGLDAGAVRNLLQGCQIALLKVKSTSR
ncbi:hypothetical protein ECG_02837 [Echinococcus granulosus]|uniref:PDZ domain-containing protein n=1 Tax=Echinococcus granulosus TaxID=6210 RepID=U6J843_ECHGR|nr:hypothetical protein EGR_06049 [Echinococcus granulosus]EUB59057.1 hypothetical protein EGR_06049 [Echinococcus granulosus]KAH9284299.1 hypothetical protein ECG_02837 [Echinococcus granulosus]CDS20201.1 hypothetical protein EgrG_000241100 [Echinococcus granulosus]